VNFLDYVVSPLWNRLSEVMPVFKEQLMQLKSNRCVCVFAFLCVSRKPVAPVDLHYLSKRAQVFVQGYCIICGICLSGALIHFLSWLLLSHAHADAILQVIKLLIKRKLTLCDPEQHAPLLSCMHRQRYAELASSEP
jgi:hypothetical protein